MTQADKLKRVNEVIELARELYIHQGGGFAAALVQAELFLERAEHYREEKRKAIITGKGE